MSRDPARTILTISHDEIGSPGHFGPVIAERGYSVELASFADRRLPKHRISDYAGVINVGAAEQVDQEHIHPWIGAERSALAEILDADVPYLGVCFGGQLLAHAVGGHVGPTDRGKLGWHRMKASPEAADDRIFATLPDEYTTFTWHLYHFELPPGAVPLAHSTTTLQAFRVRDNRAWGMQFHPELMPAAFRQVIAWIQERQFPDITESDLERYREDTERFANDQQQLAAQICSAFLDEVERAL